MIDITDVRVPATGAHAAVLHEPSGRVREPALLDGLEYRPAVNALPEARLPVAQSDIWFAEAFEGAPLRVWNDGRRRPIDELEDVEDGTSETTLIGRGGTQLEQRVTEDVIAEPAHELAERLVTEHTDYATQIDASETTETVLSISDLQEWVNAVTIVPTDPFRIGAGGLETVQTCFTQQSNAYTNWTGEVRTGRDFAVNGQVVGVGGVDQVAEWTATTAHEIPADQVSVPCCFGETTDALNSRLVLDVDGTEYTLYQFSGGQGINAAADELEWFDMAADPFDEGAGYDGPAIEAGTEVTLRLVGWGSSGDFTGLTALAPIADARYHDVSTFDTEVHEPQGHLDTPGYYPTSATIRLERLLTVLSVYGGDLSVTMDDSSGDQAIAISNDGVDWIEATNATTVSGEFDDRSSELLVRLTLARHGSQSETPRTGVEPQAVDTLSLEAWMDDTPLIADRNLSGDLIDVLDTIGNDADYLFEVRQDGSETVVHGAQPGQRDGATDLEISDYSITKHSKRVLRAVVKGGAQRVSEETVDVVDGEADLEGTDVVPGSQTVRSEDGETTYRRSFDYELRLGAGVLEVRDGGDIADGETLVVSYEHKPSGSWEHDDWDGDARTAIEEDIPAATSERACERAAKILVDEASEPRYEATVSLPARAAAGGLLEALDLERMPGGSMSVYEVRARPSGQELTLGSRDRVEEMREQIQAQLAATSERV